MRKNKWKIGKVGKGENNRKGEGWKCRERD
jgi:hypothetical protein